MLGEKLATLKIFSGEQPNFKALLMIKPKSIEDIAICLAIIRPAAKETRTAINDIDYHTKFIYDDDAIRLLSTKLKNCQ